LTTKIEQDKINKKLKLEKVKVKKMKYGEKFTYDNSEYYVFKSVDEMKKAHEEKILKEKDLFEIDWLDKSNKIELDNFIIVRRK
tara:strand:- start:130 stop:381 length:252 start_codon:yes stop_codon:yes gene_type:complete